MNKKKDSENRLVELETTIEFNLHNFYELGKALKEIRDSRLYRKIGFSSFESYTHKRWDLHKSQVYRLIESSEVMDNLSPIGDVLPKNESQTRPLTKLDPFHQRKVWSDFLSSGQKLKTRNISRFVSDYMGEEKTVSQEDRTQIISEDYKKMVMKMLHQIRIAQNERWISTSQEAALYWNSVMREKILWRS